MNLGLGVYAFLYLHSYLPTKIVPHTYNPIYTPLKDKETFTSFTERITTNNLKIMINVKVNF